MAMAEKIIIDTDPGVDDTLAIFYALQSKALDVIGLTTVFGNSPTDLTTMNALRLLEIAGRSDIPVAKGAENPLTHQFSGAVPHIHGEDGQGNVHLPPPQSKAIQQSAAQFIIDQVRAHPGEVTLVPIGPLTNIALALSLRPQIAREVKRVVLMGGAALVPGNINPAAEANIFNDAVAADIVFRAGWDITMVGLDVTHKVLMSDDQIAQFAKSTKATAQHISKVLPLYVEFAHKVLGKPGLYMHDPSAIAYLLDPSLFTVEHYPVKVATQGISRGKTWVWKRTMDFPPEEFGFDMNHKVHVVLDAQSDKVINKMLEVLL
jgi:uridine nucleosidase